MGNASRHLILWDIDGTLITNGESDEQLFTQALRDVVHLTCEVVHPYRHGKTDLQQVTEYVLANGGVREQVPAVMARLVELSRVHWAEDGEREIQPGVLETLEQAAHAGHVNGLLTGNGRERAQLKLASAGLDRSLFDWLSSFFGDGTESRTELTRTAAAYAATRSLTAVIVGDTVADGRAADAAGIGFVGVATGIDGVSELETVPHVFVLEDLSAGWTALAAGLAP